MAALRSCKPLGDTKAIFGHLSAGILAVKLVKTPVIWIWPIAGRFFPSPRPGFNAPFLIVRKPF